jgi:hypothetical protein
MAHWPTDFYITRLEVRKGALQPPPPCWGKGRAFLSVPVGQRLLNDLRAQIDVLLKITKPVLLIFTKGKP